MNLRRALRILLNSWSEEYEKLPLELLLKLLAGRDIISTGGLAALFFRVVTCKLHYCNCAFHTLKQQSHFWNTHLKNASITL